MFIAISFCILFLSQCYLVFICFKYFYSNFLSNCTWIAQWTTVAFTYSVSLFPFSSSRSPLPCGKSIHCFGLVRLHLILLPMKKHTLLVIPDSFFQMHQRDPLSIQRFLNLQDVSLKQSVASCFQVQRKRCLSPEMGKQGLMTALIHVWSLYQWIWREMSWVSISPVWELHWCRWYTFLINAWLNNFCTHLLFIREGFLDYNHFI